MTMTIACVQLPSELRYVAKAYDFNGYLVQRQFRGLGSPIYSRQYGSLAIGNGELCKEYHQYMPYWRPVLNPAAVRQAGFSHAEVMAWIENHPEQAFNHPTFTPLYLRWGKNTQGVEVTSLDTSISSSNLPPVYFTPHTCWKTGTTFFQLVSNWQENEQLFTALRSRGVLMLHRQEQGAEGKWQGWYTIHPGVAEETLQELGFSFVLDQRQEHYFVNVYKEAGQEEGLTYYTTLKEAKAHFALLPEATSANKDAYYPCANRGIIERLAGRQVWSAIVDKKPLDTNMYEWPNPLNIYQAQENANCQQDVYETIDFSPNDDPTGEVVPTLSSLLAATGKSRFILAGQLSQKQETIDQWKQNPATLTLHDLLQLAVVLEVTPAKLVTMLQEEIHAKEEHDVKKEEYETVGAAK